MQYKLIVCLLVLEVGVAVFCQKELSERRRRVRTTTTSTTPEPEASTPSITEREVNLQRREETFRLREETFREREANFTLREHALRDREYMLSVREDNVAEREKNIGPLGSAVTTTPKPDPHLMRLDPITNKYYEIGSTEPCSQNMRFFAVPDPDSVEGRCDCDYQQCSRPLIYSAQYNQCFWAWSQGPCEQNYWYTFNETLHPVCEPNDCPNKSLVEGISKYVFKDFEDGECYETTTKGYCEMEDERLLHTPEDPLPKCRTHTVCAPTSVPPQQICLPGNRRTIEGLCTNL